ncbi:hairy/enhancer-of-split related with YRPW motif protein 2 isoform X1 [Paroedura picta]|uniref:hairy/enhancer-of-split related with YRPW motif protein 2 isoform X1 n=1 Tax=Paroedura picta TaxID=143630 RepID=UPI004056E448
MKRPCEETTSESDMDETIDVGSENNYSGHSTSSVIRSNSPTTTSQIMARKKRRGIIEKRRRDRINNSLSELRRLVPTAFEKQISPLSCSLPYPPSFRRDFSGNTRECSRKMEVGKGSAKLEKAEILQMTVDHLKMLQATGGKGLPLKLLRMFQLIQNVACIQPVLPQLHPTLNGYFDAHALAMDFISIGFRECLTEVARYLSSVEGLDTSDPLRVRLVSHLSSCASQREAAAMTSSMAHHHHHHHHHPLHPHHWAAAFHHLPTALLQQNGLHSSDLSPCRLSTASEVPPHGSALLTATFAHADSTLRVPSAGSIAPCIPPLSTSLLSLSATVHAAAAAAAQSFPLSFTGAFPMLPPSAAAAVAAATAVSPPLSASAASGSQQASSNRNSKPYRPWGTEVGAF